MTREIVPLIIHSLEFAAYAVLGASASRLFRRIKGELAWLNYQRRKRL